MPTTIGFKGSTLLTKPTFSIDLPCLIFLAESKTLALSEGGCHAFLVLLLILIHAIHEFPLTQSVLNHVLFELPQIVHPVILSQLRELFELLHELLHALIVILHAQSIILASLLPQFLQLAFLLPQ